MEGTGIASFIRDAKDALDVPVALGCMRPRTGDRSDEILAMEAGADGIVLPARATRDHAAASGITVVDHEGCCALFPHLIL